MCCQAYVFAFFFLFFFLVVDFILFILKDKVQVNQTCTQTLHKHFQNHLICRIKGLPVIVKNLDLILFISLTS